ncbi:MAG: hypothetical protein JWN40_1644 [Phycisphaerales bacterium]|nr:hypothetical protein [Phycisphaerales bacterium]
MKEMPAQEADPCVGAEALGGDFAPRAPSDPTGRSKGYCDSWQNRYTVSAMPLFALPTSTRGQWRFAGVHIAMLAVALIVAWQQDGPPPERAFWAIMSYFVEIAIAGFVEIIVGISRRSRGDA